MSRTKPAQTVELRTLLIARGQFFIMTNKEVRVIVLDVTGTSLLWDGLAIADSRSKPDEARDYVLRQTFGADCTGFMPANSVECLMYFAEHYTGQHAEQVKGLCACILTGTPWTPESHMGGGIVGGEKVTQPVRPKTPSGPNGTTFPRERIQPLSEIFAEEEARLAAQVA